MLKSMMFISYPFGGQDDDQQYQRYMVQQLIEGNPYIGNLRYNTGYAFFIAPIETVASNFERLSDRLVLLFHLLVSSIVPLLVFDILHHYINRQRAFWIAFFVNLYPFGLQWAHFQLPVWLISVYLIIAIWLIHRAMQSNHKIRWFVLAGILLGFATIARLNVATMVGSIGLAVILYSNLTWRKRLVGFFLIGLWSVGVLVGYIILIHYPSTKTMTISCISGTNLLIGANEKSIPLRASNGEVSQRYAQLLTLPADFEATFYSDSYALWRIPGSWLSSAESTAFLSQSVGAYDEILSISFPGKLIYVLGPCETDKLLRNVYWEAVRLHPERFVLGFAETFIRVLVQAPYTDLADNQYLPKPEEINVANHEPLGFVRTQNGFYNGQIIWLPGVYIYSALETTLRWTVFVIPFAALWALFFQKLWFYRTVALILVVGAATISLIAIIQPRIYASMWVLYAILIAGFIDSLLQAIKKRFSHRDIAS